MLLKCRICLIYFSLVLNMDNFVACSIATQHFNIFHVSHYVVCIFPTLYLPPRLSPMYVCMHVFVLVPARPHLPPH